MSLVVVGVLALLCLAGMAWLVRQALADVQQDRAQLHREREQVAAEAQAIRAAHHSTLRFEREAFLAHLEREAQAAREERKALMDRIEAPGATAAITWQQPEATKSLTEEDEEWLQSKDSLVPWDDDLRLADSEVEG